MRAFDDIVFSWLCEDSNVRRCGYFNTSTNASAIRAYTLVVDGEASCKIGDRDLAHRIVDACRRGPWMPLVEKAFHSPHVLAMEVQMNGSQAHGAWHVDSSNFKILTVVIPLNDAYRRERGGCTEVCDETDNSIFLECDRNEFRIFDGSRLHRRTASTSSDWASRRRMVFIHFAAAKEKWTSVSAARSVHARMKRGPRQKKDAHSCFKRTTRSQTRCPFQLGHSPIHR